MIVNDEIGNDDKMKDNSDGGKIAKILDFLTFDRIAFSIGGVIIGLVIGAILMHSNNREREAYLDQQYKQLSQELENVMTMKQLSGAELRKYVGTVHEQSTIARNIQDRLHEQELALVGAENKLIYLVIAGMVVTAFIVLRISNSINERARITIQYAIGLPPAEMRDYLAKSQLVAAAAVSELAVAESNKEQPTYKTPELNQNSGKNFRRLPQKKRNNRRLDS